MQKPRDIEIDENDIFKNDLLNRESEIKNLTPIILSFNAPLVLALDSPWGAGKTTFVKLWQAYLKKEKSVESIYFNAWETDYAEDPLIVLVSELNKWLKTNHPSVANSFLDKTRKVLPSIVKQTVIAGVKIATANAVNGDQFDRIVSDATGNITGDLIDNFNKQAESVEKFKEIIAETLEELPSEQKNLIIFIDELDRCRPTYAIELLERIKHLFSIEHLVFVLSTDASQLTHSICAVYGNGFDAKKYLQRFIDLDYTLKKPEREKYVQSQLKILGIEQTISMESRVMRPHNINRLEDCLVFFIRLFDLKIRDINLLLMRVRLILYSITSNDPLDAPLLIFLLILRDKNNNLYNKYIHTSGILDEIIDFLYEASLPLKNEDVQINKVLIDISIYLTEIQKDTKIIDRERQKIENKKLTDLWSLYEKSDEFNFGEYYNKVKYYFNKNYKIILNRTVERIEFIEQINLPNS